MRWEESVLALFDDLEQQATGLRLLERDAEVAEMSRAAYAQLGLAARLHASQGCDLRLRLLGGHQVGGRLARVGADWLLLVDHAVEWIVRHAGIVSVAGLSARADSVETWSVVDRLDLRSVLRRLAVESDVCQLHFADAQQLQGRLGRVGRDFVELRVGEGGDAVGHVVPFAAVTALRGQA